MLHAQGTFEVKLLSQLAASGTEAARIGRQSIDKRFYGDLEGASLGEMLGVMSKETGSGAYVAMERVTGTLRGRQGSFVLIHHSTMSGGVPAQSIAVVPDSGTGELTGLTGALVIHIDSTTGEHAYMFDYTLEGQEK